jgi:DNA helicase II / ATP-dependent DNA helicase PcrA
MPSSENRVIIACAGSGKTSLLVNEALACTDRRIAILTYTNNNARQIISRFGESNSGVPPHVDVFTWFAFLLRECARPYQRSKYSDSRIESLLFVNTQSMKFTPESDTRRHFFADGNMIYSDKIAKFVVQCQEASRCSLTGRLKQIYTDLFIDEFQDLAGWDLDLIEQLLRSGIRVTLVGDPRQHIYSTNPSAKNKQYLGIKVLTLVEKWAQNGLCQIVPMAGSHRCNQMICGFANALWSNTHPMSSLRTDSTSHDGVFLVPRHRASEYIGKFRPQVLRHNKSAECYGSAALNFGSAKGLEFDRVLIVPTAPITKYLKTGNITQVENSRDRLHVAVTRAKHSVAFVHDGEAKIVAAPWAGSVLGRGSL